jgi:hexosaminidase
MKHKLLLTLALVLSAVLYIKANDKPYVIPELKEWKADKGTMSLADNAVVAYEDDRLANVASQLSEDFSTMFGKKLSVKKGKASSGDIELRLKKDKKMPSEGYNMQVGKNIVIDAPEVIGVFWGTRTLLQMAEQSQDYSFPCGKIKDFPDYAIRGFMIDCGRKYIPMSFLEDYVKIMSYYKMNTLQVHLNDNGFKQFFDYDWNKTYAAFRLESETFPGLAAADGYYTKKEFVNLQKLGEKNFVEIIPEIDAPAHVLAFTHYKPELGSDKYGMDHFDLFNPAVYDFMDALLKEYLEGDEPVFRGKRVHIGTDEYSNKDKEVVEKFRYFTDRYIKYVEGFGKQACVWGALTHANGETPVKSENVIMNAWYNGYADPVQMVKDGYKLISIPDGYLYIVPQAGYYYDYLDTKSLYDEWTPAKVGEAVFPEKDPAILGGMFAVWNDHCGNGISIKDIHYRVFPALQTLAVKMWTGANPQISYDEFVSKSNLLSEAPGVNQSARLGKNGGRFEQAVVSSGSTLPYKEVGCKYSVSFDIDGLREQPGTELFRSDNAVFYLADPITGRMGYARDGYLNTFMYSVIPGKANIRIEGDSTQTSLFVNGKLVEKKDIGMIYYDEGKVKMKNVRTLVFPLEKAGNFKSKITNLKVEQSL